jgi:hypothetical protein
MNSWAEQSPLPVHERKKKKIAVQGEKSDHLLPQWVLKVYRKEPSGQRTLATDKY